MQPTPHRQPTISLQYKGDARDWHLPSAQGAPPKKGAFQSQDPTTGSITPLITGKTAQSLSNTQAKRGVTTPDPKGRATTLTQLNICTGCELIFELT
jgi:hypothetical protein